MSRREKIEAMLADEPGDVFLRYTLAMEIAKEDKTEAVAQLGELNDSEPDYVPAWLQRGQLLAELDRIAEAREVYLAGIATARRVGDTHAEGEMTGFLELLPEV